MLTVDEFAGITRKIIAKDGFEDYLPTAIYPDRRELVVLEEAPEGVALEAIAVAWAAKGAIAGEEFLVAFKVGPTRFKVVRDSRGAREEGTFEVGGHDV